MTVYPEGLIRTVPAPDYASAGIVPIAIEQFSNGVWVRIGFIGSKLGLPVLLSDAELKEYQARQATEA